MGSLPGESAAPGHQNIYFHPVPAADEDVPVADSSLYGAGQASGPQEVQPLLDDRALCAGRVRQAGELRGTHGGDGTPGDKAQSGARESNLLPGAATDRFRSGDPQCQSKMQLDHGMEPHNSGEALRAGRHLLQGLSNLAVQLLPGVADLPDGPPPQPAGDAELLCAALLKPLVGRDPEPPPRGGGDDIHKV